MCVSFISFFFFRFPSEPGLYRLITCLDRKFKGYWDVLRRMPKANVFCIYD